MLLGMLKWQKRVLPFTVLVALLFTMGQAAAGTGSEAAAAQGVSAPAPDEVPVAPPEASVVDAQTYYVDTDPSAVTLWRQELEPHGMWIEDPAYGLVWVPDPSVVGGDFVPYLSAGHWGYTAEGEWLWVSDYEWGWVAFHYGRWVWIPERGWAWIPGRMYAPAWVVWRVGNPGYAYVGWAPMPPEYYWYGGVAVSLWVVPPPYYVYCESHYVFDHHVHHHHLRGHHARAAANHTSPHRPDSPRGRHAAKPNVGPSLEEARVPANAVPRTPATPHPKAIGSATPASGGNSGAAMRPVSSRPSSRVAGVSEPRYRGRPSGAVPVERRATPLATRPDVRAPRGNEAAMPRASRTLGRSWNPPQTTTGRTGWQGPRAAPTERYPRPSARPSTGSGHAPTPSRAVPQRTQPGRASGAGPSPRPSYTEPSRPSSNRSARPSYESSRPSYGPSSRPSYGPSRPSYGPSRPNYSAPARPSGGYNNNNNNNSGPKSRGRGKSGGRRR